MKKDKRPMNYKNFEILLKGATALFAVGGLIVKYLSSHENSQMGNGSSKAWLNILVNSRIIKRREESSKNQTQKRFCQSNWKQRDDENEEVYEYRLEDWDR